MSTRILHLDLDAAVLPRVEADGGGDVWAVGWRDGVPAGVVKLRVDPRSDRRWGDRLLRRLRSEAAPHDGPPPPPSSRAPSVSVVICTRDRPARLPLALDALRTQDLPPAEVIVVDNAPRDGACRRLLRERYPEARYVHEPVPGLPRARNAGVRAAGGDVVAFTDDDCVPTRRWVERIAAEFAAVPHLGCATGPILPLELDTPAQCAMEARGGFNRGFRRELYRLEDARGPVYPVQAWIFGAGGSMALSRACLEAIGGFDEALWRSEDLDVFYRTLRSARPLVFDPGICVRHRHLPGWRPLTRRLWDWGWSYLALLDKIAREDEPRFAERARVERRNWLRWQAGRRLLPALRGRAELPFPLIAAELAGGAMGMRGYAAARALTRLRTARAAAGAAPLCPGPRPTATPL